MPRNTSGRNPYFLLMGGYQRTPFLAIGGCFLVLVSGIRTEGSLALAQGVTQPKASTSPRESSVPRSKAQEDREILARLQNRRALLVAYLKKMADRQKEIEQRIRVLHQQQRQTSLPPSERSALENIIAFEKSRIQQIVTRRKLLIQELNLLVTVERQLRSQKISAQRGKNL